MDTRAEVHLAQVQQGSRATIAGHLRRGHRYLGWTLAMEPRGELLLLHHMEHQEELVR